jgi:hypothetical protein
MSQAVLSDEKSNTYRMANLVGRAIMMGQSAKTRMKQTRATTLQPAKMRRRSHRLTVRVSGGDQGRGMREDCICTRHMRDANAGTVERER